MGELAIAMKMMTKMSTAILKYPNGKYGLERVPRQRLLEDYHHVKDGGY